VIDPDGTHRVRIADNLLHPNWSPDRTQLVAYNFDRYYPHTVYVMGADGSHSSSH
jgi:hypothetical protein